MAGSRPAGRPGSVVGNRYRLHALIGSGASASVYLADDHILGRPVAVKVLNEGLADDERFLRRFRVEAQAAAALDHPNITAVYDWGEELAPGRSGHRRVPYLVTEYLDGGSLRAMLRRGACLTPAQVLKLGLEAVRALEYAHRQGAVHRDLKPANLLFDDEGSLRITDFGLARALAEANWSEPGGSLAGTVRYASPEQARGEPLDGRSDVYSLALVLVEALTGQVPFVTDTALGTLMARLDQPLPVGEELGDLAEPLRRAGDPDRDRRLDASGLRRAFARIAERFDAPGDLPLAGSSPEPLDDDDLGLAPGTSGRIGAGVGSVAAAGPLVGAPADATTVIPTPGAPVPDATTVIPTPGAPVFPEGAPNGAGGAHRPAYRTLAGSGRGARTGPPGPVLADRNGGGGVAAAERPVGAGDRPPPPTGGRPDPPGGDGARGGPPPVGTDPTVVQPLPRAVVGAPAPWAPAWDGPPFAGTGDGTQRWRVVIVVAALVAGAIVGGAYWWSNIRVPSFAVPVLVQRPVDEVPELIAGHQWVVQRDDEYDDAVPAGFVASQQPAPATEVLRGGSIHIVVSRGPRPVEVPAIYPGVTVEQATAALQGVGLVAEVQERRNDENVPPNGVIMLGRDTPRALPKGSKVGLVVSDGPAPRTVPSGLAGRTYDDVDRQLKGLGLVPRRDDQFDATVPAGTVMRVDPPEGTGQLAKGSPVTVTVSRGAAVLVPDVRNLDVNTAAAQLQAFGLQVGEVRGWSIFTTVRGTDPAPNTPVAPGTKVNLIVGL